MTSIEPETKNLFSIEPESHIDNDGDDDLKISFMGDEDEPKMTFTGEDELIMTFNDSDEPMMVFSETPVLQYAEEPEIFLSLAPDEPEIEPEEYEFKMTFSSEKLKRTETDPLKMTPQEKIDWLSDHTVRKRLEPEKEIFEVQVVVDAPESLPKGHSFYMVQYHICSNGQFAHVDTSETLRLGKGRQTFKKGLKQEFQFGMEQLIKLVFVSSDAEEGGNIKEFAEIQLYLADILTSIKKTTLNESAGELLANLKRAKDFTIEYKKDGGAQGGKDAVATVILIPPEPKDNIIPRTVDKTKTHIVISKTDHFRDLEYQSMSVTLRLGVDGLKAMGKEVNVDPYFVVFKDGLEFQAKLYQSEVQENSKGRAVWRIFTFGLGARSSLDNFLRIEFWTKKRFIGIFTTTVQDLRNGALTFTLRDPSVPNENRGTVTVLKYEERIWFTELITKKTLTSPQRIISQYYHVNPFSTLHYLGFHKLHLTIAVDYTASNGQLPGTNKGSLHYIGDKTLNPYEICIKSMISSVFQYNDQVLPRVYGFGHMKSNSVKEDHFIIQKGPSKTKIEVRALGSKDDPISKTLAAYRKTTKATQMGLANNFRQIIEEVSEDAMSAHSYCILVILCDGDRIPHLDTYMGTLRQTYRSGISVVFIGIGEEKFNTLKMMQSECTNVTFVRYVDNQELLGVKALKKVPDQMRDYYASRKEVPEIQQDINYVQ